MSSEPNNTNAVATETTNVKDDNLERLKKEISPILTTMFGTRPILKKVLMETLRLAVEASVDDPDSVVIRETLDAETFERRCKKKDEVRSRNALVLAFVKYVHMHEKYGENFGALIADGKWIAYVYQIVNHFVDILEEKVTATEKLEASEIVWILGTTRFAGSPFLEDASIAVKDMIEKDQESRDNREKKK